MQHTQGWVPADTFGARLALIRQSMGWATAAEAAFACGDLGDQNWRNWEAGRRPREFERVCRKIVQHADDCDLDWLMRGGPLEVQKFAMLMRPDLRIHAGEAESSDRLRGHLHMIR